MCLIMTMEDHNKVITEEDFRLNLDRNMHGTGVMYAQNGKVRVFKEIGSLEKQVALFNKFVQHFKDKRFDALYVHSRLKTFGAIDEANCHPYEVLDGEGVNSLCMMHNGSMRDIKNDIEKEKSDTYHFVNYYLRRLLKNDPNLIHDEFFQEMIQKMMGTTNKLVFLNGVGDSVYINKDQGAEKDGCWISNEYSMRKPVKNSVIHYSGGGYYRGNAGYNNTFNRAKDAYGAEYNNDEIEDNVVDLKKSQKESTSLTKGTNPNTASATTKPVATVNVDVQEQEETNTNAQEDLVLAVETSTKLLVAACTSMSERELFNFITEEPEAATEVLSSLLEDTRILINAA